MGAGSGREEGREDTVGRNPMPCSKRSGFNDDERRVRAMSEQWINNPCEQCEEHGASVEIFTSAEQTIPGAVCAYDGDECRCSDGCKGWMTADDDAFYCNWHDAENKPLAPDHESGMMRGDG